MASLKRLLSFGKGLAVVTSGNALASLLGGLFWFLIATIIPVKEYGILNFHISIATVASLVSLLGLNTVIVTFIPKGNMTIRNEAVQLSFISSAVISVITFILIGSFTTSLLLFALTLFTMSWSNAIATKSYRTYFVRVVAQRASQIGLSIVLYFYFGTEGLLLGYAITSLAFSYDFFKFLKFNVDFTELKKKSTFIWHSYSQSLSTNISLYLDKLVVAQLFGFTTLGLYQISFQFLMFLALIPLSLYQYLLPRESLQMQNKKFVIIGIAVAITSCLIFYFTVPIIINTLFPKFVDSIRASQIMVLGVIPMTVTAILNSKFIGRERTRPVVIGSLVYIALLLACEITLGHLFGLLGLSVSVLVSLTGQCAVLLLSFRYMNGTINVIKY